MAFKNNNNNNIDKVSIVDNINRWIKILRTFPDFCKECPEFFKMTLLFSLIGDTNVKQNVTKNSMRGCPGLKSCQVLHCTNLENFASRLAKVRAESDVCLVSCISGFLAVSEGTSVSRRVDPILQEVHAGLMEACLANPARRYMVAPPMYRQSPLWYRDGLPEILTLFSQVMNSDKSVSNLHLLPSFATPEFDKDGILLTPYSGMEFVLSLFDGAQEVIENLDSGVDQKSTRNQEATRVLEDRVVALEQDHRRLNHVVDDKIAIDAEMDDFLKNERFEDTFVIEGLPRIPDDISGKPWQERAVRDTQRFIKTLMGKSMSIVFVSNATKRVADAIVVYNVKMLNIADSKAIRTKFGSYFVGGKGDQRPESMKPYSVKNRVTPETSIRISVLKLLAQRYRDSNPGLFN